MNNKITLFPVTISCECCSYEWKSLDPRWDRGHILLQKADNFIYVMDDTCVYGLKCEIKEIRHLLCSFGWKHLCECPECGESEGQIVKQDVTSIQKDCINLETNDFVKIDNQWQLTEDAKTKCA